MTLDQQDTKRPTFSTWTAIQKGSDCPGIRDAPQCIKMDSNRVLLAGNWFGPQVSVYHISQNEWTDKQEWFLPHDWAFPPLMKVDDKILILGGRKSETEFTTRVMQLDEKSGWKDLEPLPAAGHRVGGGITPYKKSYPKPNCT